MRLDSQSFVVGVRFLKELDGTCLESAMSLVWFDINDKLT